MADLDGGKTQCGGGAEERGDEGEDVDKLAQRAVGIAGAEQRLENRGHQRDASAAVGGIGDGAADEGIGCPGRDSPVVVRLGHGLVQGLDAVAVDGVRRRGEVVRQRL